MISEDKISEVRARVDIVAIIGKKVTLKRAGHGYVGLCPFHNERSPSFNVNPQRGFYHCFGCQASGDGFKFGCETESTPFPQVVRDLAQEVGVTIPEVEESAEEQGIRKKRQWLYRVNEFVSHFFIHQLWSSKQAERARKYIAERQVDESTARAFGLGYAPRRPDELLAYLEAKNIPKEAAVDLGVLGARDDGSLYQRFFDRVIFPIYDERGQVAGFGGRILDADPKAAKYLNSPESPVFKKGSLFYGFEKARNHIARQGGAILCEGYLDVIAMHQAGFTQAVAPLGTALTPEHLPLLKRSSQRVYTMFDGDSAGLKATRKSAELMLAHGFSVHVIALPPGDDPDTFVQREGAETLRERIKQAPAAMQFFIDMAAREMSPSVEGRLGAARDIAPLLAKISAQLERDLYVKEASRKLQIDEHALRRFFGSAPRPVSEQASPTGQGWSKLAQAGAPQPRSAAQGSASRAEARTETVRPPDPVEWAAALEIFKYRALWEALPTIEALIVHEGLRRIVTQCIEDDAELTLDMMESLLGSAALARNLAVVLSDDLSPMLEPAGQKRLLADVTLGLEHYRKRVELLKLDQMIQEGGPNETELLRKKSELIRWLKREKPRFVGIGGANPPPKESGS